MNTIMISRTFLRAPTRKCPRKWNNTHTEQILNMIMRAQMLYEKIKKWFS